jgi:flagellar protein FlgJ
MLNINHADVYTDFNGLAKLKTEAQKDSQEALKEVAKQFESIFVNLALKSMRDAKLSDGILDSDQSKFFLEMYDQQLSVHLSGDPGIGLADLIVRQLSKDKSQSNLQEMDLSAYRSNPVEISDGKIEKTESVTELKTDANMPINSVRQFVSQLWPYAQQAAREIGVEPKVLLAQAALETGWGRFVINNAEGQSSFNLFNIKADKSWHGDKTIETTLEFDQGIGKKVQAGFRVYDSYQQSFQDYVQFIKGNPRYREALRQAGNPESYVNALQQAGYATDPEYAEKIMQIYHDKVFVKYQPSEMLATNERGE